MAITTYSELQTAIQNWVARDDSTFTDRIPEFISLAESDMNREVSLRENRVRYTTTTTSGDEYVDVPDDLRKIISFRVDADADSSLLFVTPEQMNTLFRSGYTGQPQRFTVVGSDFRLGPTPDAAYTLELVYERNFPPLSDTNTTNGVLTRHPEMYLNGALHHAHNWLQDETKAAYYGQLFLRGMEKVRTDERDIRGGSLQVRSDVAADVGMGGI